MKKFVIVILLCNSVEALFLLNSLGSILSPLVFLVHENSKCTKIVVDVLFIPGNTQDLTAENMCNRFEIKLHFKAHLPVVIYMYQQYKEISLEQNLSKLPGNLCSASIFTWQ